VFALSTANWGVVVGAVAAVAAVVGFVFAGVQFSATKRATFSQFLLDLDDHFFRYWDVHVALMRTGKWTHGRGPSSNEEWASVEGYMGLFERLHALLENGTVKKDYVEHFYKYRLANLWANPVIYHEKLREGSNVRTEWTDFVALSEAMGIETRRGSS
jgi:hypothetical protein